MAELNDPLTIPAPGSGPLDGPADLKENIALELTDRGREALRLIRTAQQDSEA